MYANGINKININDILDDGSHKDAGGVEDFRDSTNETTRHMPSTQGTTSALIDNSVIMLHYYIFQERMNPAEGGEGAYNCYIKRCVNLCRTNCTKCPYMGKH